MPRGRPRKAPIFEVQAPPDEVVADAFDMIVVAPSIPMGGGKRAVTGERVTVTGHRRASLLLWGQARDA